MLKETMVMLVSIVTNIVLSFLKVIVGLVGKSGALVADGIHSFSDLTTDFVAIIGNKMARKPADDEHPDGHGKSEYLTSMIIGAVVLIMGFTVLYEAFGRKIIVPEVYVIIISVFTIVSKYFLARYITSAGRKLKNNVLIASGLESNADVLSSIFVLVSILLMQLTKYNSIFGYADMIAMIVVGLVIIKTGYSILKENVGTILGEQVLDEEYLNKVKSLILKGDRIKDICEFTLIKYGPYYKLTLGIIMDKDTYLEEIYNTEKKLVKLLKKFDKKLEYITVYTVPDKE